MTSKQRVREAITHRQPDKLPANFECVESVMKKLLKHYSYSEPEQVLQRYDTDIRPLMEVKYEKT